MYHRYCGTAEEGGRNYPEEFSHQLKAYTVWQKIEGVDTLLFGMYVQEYGNDSPLPNRGSAYLSYLDSVKYFQPPEVRTRVYHELLISYLKQLRERGFNQLVLWACPPKEGDDYIIYCHPLEHRTPKDVLLQNWYLAMLEKAQSQGIVERLTWLPDDYWPSCYGTEGGYDRDITQVPYFEGDYWPRIVEDECKEYTNKAQPGPGPDLQMNTRSPKGGNAGSVPNQSGELVSSTVSQPPLQTQNSDGDHTDNGKECESYNHTNGVNPTGSDSDSDLDFLEEDDADPHPTQPEGQQQNGETSDSGGQVGGKPPPPPPPPPTENAGKTPPPGVENPHTKVPKESGAGSNSTYKGKNRKRTKGEVKPVGGNGDMLPEDQVRDKVVQQLTQTSAYLSRSFIIVKLRPSCQVFKHYIPVDQGYYKYIGAPTKAVGEAGLAAGKHPLYGPDGSIRGTTSPPFSDSQRNGPKNSKGKHKRQNRKEEFLKSLASRQQHICCLSKEAWNLSDEQLIAALGKHPVAQEFQRSHFVYVPYSTNPHDERILGEARKKSDQVKKEGDDSSVQVAAGASNDQEHSEANPVHLKQHSIILDADKAVNNDIFATRQLFLDLCRNNNFQFDQLRRAKYSSMMILHHLHNPDAPAFVHLCNLCQGLIHTGSRFTCNICEDVDYCNVCKDKAQHPHRLQEYNVNGSLSHLNYGRDTLLVVSPHDKRRSLSSLRSDVAERRRDAFMEELEKAAEGIADSQTDGSQLLAHVKYYRSNEDHVAKCVDCSRYRQAVRIHARRRAHRTASCSLPFCDEERRHITQERDDRNRRAVTTLAVPRIDRRFSRLPHEGDEEDDEDDDAEDENASQQDEMVSSQDQPPAVQPDRAGKAGVPSSSGGKGKGLTPGVQPQNGPQPHPLTRRSSKVASPRDIRKAEEVRRYIKKLPEHEARKQEERLKHLRSQLAGQGYTNEKELKLKAYVYLHEFIRKEVHRKRAAAANGTVTHGGQSGTRVSSQIVTPDPSRAGVTTNANAVNAVGGPAIPVRTGNTTAAFTNVTRPVPLKLNDAPVSPLDINSPYEGIQSSFGWKTSPPSFSQVNEPIQVGSSAAMSGAQSFAPSFSGAPVASTGIVGLGTQGRQSFGTAATVATMPQPSLSIPLKSSSTKRSRENDFSGENGAHNERSGDLHYPSQNNSHHFDSGPSKMPKH
eukprot:gb/GECG01010654.1/.p1 GENE.gb/GECG01010654.1/~~gb/GECG01010654.1/.p1  ORF type:complete len:1183 (+),score=158.76 gb/GECG01010654.1/:1-3549(+)